MFSLKFVIPFGTQSCAACQAQCVAAQRWFSAHPEVQLDLFQTDKLLELYSFKKKGYQPEEQPANHSVHSRQPLGWSHPEPGRQAVDPRDVES